MFQNFLVPIDGSELSQQSTNAAIGLAAEVSARIVFFHALPDAESSVYGEASLVRTIDPELFDRVLNERASTLLATAQGAAQAAGVPSAGAVGVADEPYGGIIAAAEEHGCDIIVMASHGYRGVKGLLLGSQTQKVLTHSTIPVLVYRGQGESATSD